MNLRNKLFLSIGALLVVLSLIMYFLPYFLIEDDIQSASNTLKELAKSEEEDFANSQQKLLEKQLDDIEVNIDSLLYMVQDSAEIRKNLTFSNHLSKKILFETLARFLAYDPSIGLVQLTDVQQKQTIAILSNQIPFYTFETSPLIEGALLVNLNKEHVYIGIPVGGGTNQQLLLFDAHSIEKAHISDAAQNSLSRTLYAVQQFMTDKKILTETNSNLALTAKNLPGNVLKKDFAERTDWATSVHMIQILAPYYGMSLDESSLPTPDGVAETDVLGRPLALLSVDVFRQHPLFNDIEYFQRHSDLAEPIANERILIKDPRNQDFYLSNTLELQNAKATSLLTIGTPLYSFVRNLALSSDRWVILMTNNKIIDGFNDNGMQLLPGELNQFTKQLQRDDVDYKNFPFLGNNYSITQISLQPKWDLNFFLLSLKEKEKIVETTLSRLNQTISDRISSHILLVAIGALLLALLILGRISLNISRPIAKLATATEHVVSGKYEQIELPDVRNRKDEVAILTESFRTMVKGLKDKEHIRAVLNKVVSEDVANEILKTNIRLGGEDRVVSVLFSDIRGFTKLTENLAPQVVIAMLNTYMTKMSRVIEGEGGCIDKYVGDEIMALYGAPIDHPDHAIRSISSAILMMESLKKWNRERIQKKLPSVEMGIGIHTGLVVAGNMGAEDRLNYTVLGSSVNLASRICGIAEPMQILISQSTYQEANVKESFKIEPLPAVYLKGFSEPINVFQVNGFEWS